MKSAYFWVSSLCNMKLPEIMSIANQAVVPRSLSHHSCLQNFFNHGGRLGQAAGFRLTTLGKLQVVSPSVMLACSANAKPEYFFSRPYSSISLRGTA